MLPALPAAVRRPAGALPAPPTDAEELLYLGPQWRWVTPVSGLGYLLIAASVALFVRQHAWAAVVLLPLAVGAVGTIASLITSSHRRRDTAESHRARVSGWRPARDLSVDVFLPSAGEELAVLRNTFRHVARLEWPGQLAIYVLDDSGRAEVAELAADHGFRYLSRPDRGHFKKSGNLRYGYEHSTGDYIFVLDADFVPRTDALLQIAPYLDEPETGIVQTPQFFDISARMNWLQRAAGATQILFYRWVQPSLDRSRAPICVGTSALYRRAALDAAGGFPLINHSEDVHTGVNLMKVGFLTRYVPVIVTKGLCPTELDQFLSQQYRWCSGSMSLLFSRDFHRTKLTAAQRAAYWSGFLYYITTAINVFVVPVPTLLMAWFAPDGVSIGNYAFVLLAMVVRQAVIPFITLQSDSMVGLARIEMAYSYAHAVSLIDMLRGRTDAWVATGAASGPVPAHASRPRRSTGRRVIALARVWCIVVQALMWAAIAVNAPHYGLLAWSLVIIFALLNLYTVYPLIWAKADAPLLADLLRRARRALLAPVPVAAPVLVPERSVATPGVER